MAKHKFVPDTTITMVKIFSLKITLNQTNPAIWRRVLVPSSVTFFDLHHIIQISMGWTNSHLFEFQVGDYKIGYTDSVNDGFGDVAHASEVTLDLLLMKKGLTFRYLYDFGDSWWHTVKVEKILSKEDGKVYPVCIEGQLACPTEDSGGIYRFYDNLEILKNPKHPEYKQLKRWLGRDYNPEKFDIKMVNTELPRFKKWMKNWK